MNIDLKTSLGRAYDHYVRNIESPRLLAKHGFLMANRDLVECKASERAIVPHYSLQNLVRPLYGKGPALPPDIGDHPDFRHLKGTDGEIYCPITTLFMDIESSTRLSLLHPLPWVRRIKNAFICAAIEIARSFDGHVHRMMGDSVLAFFGGKDAHPESATVDALNCAALLRYFVDAVVIPRLKEDGFEDPFGIRIGIDHGSKDDVLWSSYGYPGVEEVTATSFYVDVAAKLQHSAGRNQIMIGESLRSLLDFPDDLLQARNVILNGHEVTKPYIEPNHTDKEGKAINYRQHVFNWEKFLPFTPIGQHDSRFASKMEVAAAVYDADREAPARYYPCSRVLPKERLLEFKIKLPYVPKLPYNLVLRVENHGAEARTRGGENLGNHQMVTTVSTNEQHHNLVHLEATAYRGLHYLRVEAQPTYGAPLKTDFGVFIE